MDSITARILDGEIVLTQGTNGLCAIALTEKLEGRSIVTKQPVLSLRVTATKKGGETVDVRPTGIVGRSVIDGHDVLKVTVEIITAPTLTTSFPAPVSGFCRCDGEADTHGVCYRCGGYQRAADAGRYM